MARPEGGEKGVDHLGEVDQCWYVIGKDLLRNGLRTFALPRIKGLKVLVGKGFEIPAAFDGGAYLGSSFGIWTEPPSPSSPHFAGHGAALRGG